MKRGRGDDVGIASMLPPTGDLSVNTDERPEA